MRVIKAIIFIIILAAVFPAVGFSDASGWISGFSVSSEGFSGSENFNDSEYVGVSLYVEPWCFPFLTPSLSAGVMIAAAPLDFSASLLTAELGLELFSIEEHPFQWAVDMDSHYSPLLSARLLVPVAALDAPYWSLCLSPFRLKTGSGRYSLMSAFIVGDSSLAYSGWGIKLFDIRLFIF